MTIDERLEKLTERHEALTLSVELMQRDFQNRFDQITQAIQQDAENIRALARIAEIHEHRLTALEGGDGKS
jgi:archaellum component FlaC